MDCIDISFDPKGNLYFEYINKTYQVEIDKNSNPELVLADYSIVDTKPSIDIGNITILDDKNTKKQLDEHEYPDSVSYGSIPLSMYPEESGYLFSCNRQQYSNSEDFYDEDEQEGYFTFAGSGYEINERKNGYYNALYDTFIIDNNTIKFRTKLIGEPPHYVIIVDGLNIKFRDTSTLNVYKQFKIVKTDDGIMIDRC